MLYLGPVLISSHSQLHKIWVGSQPECDCSRKLKSKKPFLGCSSFFWIWSWSYLRTNCHRHGKRFAHLLLARLRRDPLAHISLPFVQFRPRWAPSIRPNMATSRPSAPVLGCQLIQAMREATTAPERFLFAIWSKKWPKKLDMRSSEEAR